MSPDNSTSQIIALDNAQLFPFILDLLEQGHTATVELRGFSMRPFLEDRRDDAVLRKATAVVVGEPVLAEIAQGRYVLHRVIAVAGEHVTLLGDGNTTPEHCLRKDVKAQVVGFYRKGTTKLCTLTSWQWRTYSFFWTLLRPLRRYLLALYQRWAHVFGPL